jgi:hypothetical protein
MIRATILAVPGMLEEREALLGALGPVGQAGKVSPSGAGRSPDEPTPGMSPAFRHIGFAVLALQGLGLFIWSWVLYHRYGVGSDFAGYEQAWYLMAHGHLNPYLTVWGEPFFRSHAEIIMWLLAPLWWLSPSGVTLLWVQDIAIVLTECVALAWMCEVAAERSGRGGWKLPGLGLLLLVANPWMYWAASFDFHAEVLGACFAMLAAFDLAHHRSRTWIWVGLGLACGDVSATYIAGVGISALLAGSAWRRKGAVFILLGAAFTGLATVIGSNAGSDLAIYNTSPAHSGHGVQGHSNGVSGLGGLLTSPFRAPGRFFHDLWPNRLNVYANLAPAGGIGIFCAWGFGVPLVVILENNLRPAFSVTAAQNFPMYCFVSLGTVMVLARIDRWKPVVAGFLAVVLALSTLGWFAVWFPRTSGQWLRVSPAAASAIQRGTSSIPSVAEVVASHGVEGALAGRSQIYTLKGTMQIRAQRLIFVATPAQGIETTPLPTELSELGQLAKIGGRLISSGGGAWVFEWVPPRTTKEVNLGSCQVLPAWALSSRAGRPLIRGPVSSWGMVATGGRGYLIYGDYAREAPGSYDAEVTLTSHGPLSVEVWDSDRNVLLARRTVPATGTTAHVIVPFTALAQASRPATSGAGVFRIVPIPPPLNDQVEVRVYTAGGVRAVVSSVRYERASKPGQSVAPRTTTSC